MSLVSNLNNNMNGVNYLGDSSEAKKSEPKQENSASLIASEKLAVIEKNTDLNISDIKADIIPNESNGTVSNIIDMAKNLIPIPRTRTEIALGGVGAVFGKGVAAVHLPLIAFKSAAGAASLTLQSLYVPQFLANGMGSVVGYLTVGATTATLSPLVLTIGAVAGGAATVYSIRALSPLAIKLAEASKNGIVHIYYGTPTVEELKKLPEDVVVVSEEELIEASITDEVSEEQTELNSNSDAQKELSESQK
jgi:hypothetical protein